LSHVTVVETLLVYAGAPLAVILVLALLTLVPGRTKRARYRPGQPWDHEPVWYEPHPEGMTQTGGGDAHGPLAHTGHSELGTGRQPAALTAGDGTGSTAASAAGDALAQRAAAVGPLGGARGTW
jgi:hypothetical protein